MKYAFYPGCVAKGACPELKVSAENLATKLGMDLLEIKEFACTGAGVLSEHDSELSDTVNARNFALAEQKGLPLMNICSTCQGNMSHSNYRMKNDGKLLERVNKILSEQGLKYSGNLTIKNMMWVIVEDFGLEKLKSLVKKPLNVKVAPFYGCYILRPTWELEISKDQPRNHYLEMIIEACGGTAVDYDGKDKCCGFPIQAMNSDNSQAMAKNHVLDAKNNGAACMVTPCPLCHLQLDANQPDYAKNAAMPVLHLPQMIGLALGMSQEELALSRHIIKLDKVFA